MLEVAEQGRDTPGVFLDVAVLAQGVWSTLGAALAECAGSGSHCVRVLSARGAQALLIAALTPGELAHTPAHRV